MNNFYQYIKKRKKAIVLLISIFLFYQIFMKWDLVKSYLYLLIR